MLCSGSKHNGTYVYGMCGCFKLESKGLFVYFFKDMKLKAILPFIGNIVKSSLSCVFTPQFVIYLSAISISNQTDATCILVTSKHVAHSYWQALTYIFNNDMRLETDG